MAQIDKSVANEMQHSGFLDAYRQILPAALRHPATWLLTLLWVGANVYLLVAGNVSLAVPLLNIAAGIVTLVVTLLIIAVTQGAPVPAWETVPFSRSRFWLQVAVTLLCVVLIGLTTVFATLRVSPFFSSLYTLFRASPLTPFILILPLEIVLPLGAAFLLGARRRELGFQKGYRTWRVAALASAPSIIVIIVAIIIRRISLLTLIVDGILLLLVAGFPEEVSMRGVLMTRLMRLLGTGWGIALSSLVFGLLHFGTDIANAGSTNILTVLAVAISGQMIGGFGFAVTFQRTQSLTAGVISHTLSDIVAGIF